jgi:hypothetical protein
MGRSSRRLLSSAALLLALAGCGGGGNTVATTTTQAEQPSGKELAARVYAWGLSAAAYDIKLARCGRGAALPPCAGAVRKQYLTIAAGLEQVTASTSGRSPSCAAALRRARAIVAQTSAALERSWTERRRLASTEAVARRNTQLGGRLVKTIPRSC